MEAVDIAIVGCGPAGISAALNAKIRNKSYYLFGGTSLSDKVQRSERISNYPGLADIGGDHFNRQLSEQMEQAEISITEKRITGIYHMGKRFSLLSGREMFEARTIILATGVETVRPIPGEREFLGRGVSYCATCDGNLYKGKKIAVVCDNAEMEEEAEFLAKLADKVYYRPVYQGSAFAAENAEKMDSAVTEVFGKERVDGVRLKDGSELAVDGIFFLKQSVSPTVLLRELEAEDGHVAVNRRMETNIRGCYAAGDCTGTPYQIAKAVGEGNVAVHSAMKYLAQLQKEAVK